MLIVIIIVLIAAVPTIVVLLPTRPGLPPPEPPPLTPIQRYVMATFFVVPALAAIAMAQVYDGSAEWGVVLIGLLFWGSMWAVDRRCYASGRSSTISRGASEGRTESR